MVQSLQHLGGIARHKLQRSSFHLGLKLKTSSEATAALREVLLAMPPMPLRIGRRCRARTRLGRERVAWDCGLLGYAVFGVEYVRPVRGWISWWPWRRTRRSGRRTRNSSMALTRSCLVSGVSWLCVSVGRCGHNYRQQTMCVCWITEADGVEFIHGFTRIRRCSACSLGFPSLCLHGVIATASTISCAVQPRADFSFAGLSNPAKSAR